jgi:hypothetical protein
MCLEVLNLGGRLEGIGDPNGYARFLDVLRFCSKQLKTSKTLKGYLNHPLFNHIPLLAEFKLVRHAL